MGETERDILMVESFWVWALFQRHQVGFLSGEGMLVTCECVCGRETRREREREIVFKG